MSQYTPCHSARGTVDLELKLSRTSIELVGEIGLSLSSGRPGSVRTYGSSLSLTGARKIMPLSFTLTGCLYHLFTPHDGLRIRLWPDIAIR